MVSYHSAKYNEKHHDRSDEQEHITAKSRGEFMERVTADDPLRRERDLFLYGGGNFRMFYLSKTRADDESTFFPMAFDAGIRVRPTPKHLSFVLETRYFNEPKQEGLDETFSGAKVRSAYVMVDDLPFATYAQYGLYRPLFGHYTSDHESLFSRLTGFDQNYVAHAASVGGSPNVPFVNLHAIMPTTDGTNKDSGFAANVGGRFVTMGASIMLSYWQTENEDLFNKTMYGINGGLKVDMPWKGYFSFLVFNGDITTVDFELAGTDTRNKGNVNTYEVKWNIARENYIVGSWATSNISGAQQALREEGESTEYALGFKSFPVSGVELEVLAVNREDIYGDPEETQSVDYIQGQFHVFF